MGDTSDSDFSLAELKTLRDLSESAPGWAETGLDGYLENALSQAAEILQGEVGLSALGQTIWGRRPQGDQLASKTIAFDYLDLDLILEFDPNLADRPTNRFVEAFTIQVRKTLDRVIIGHRSTWVDALTGDFFEQDLNPEVCFDLLASRLEEIFPDTRLLSIARTDVVQVLARRDDPGSLRIVSTTGTERGGIVGIRESVVGLLFDVDRAAEEKYLLGDPTKPPMKNVYKDFAKDTEIRSELAVPLLKASEVIAVVNLESAEVDGFTELHAKYLIGMADRLALMIKALQRQSISDSQARLAIVSAQSKYWESVGRILRHDIRTPATKILFSAEEIGDSAREVVAGLAQPPAALELDVLVRTGQTIIDDAAVIKKGVADQEAELKEFMEQFVDYMEFRQFDLRELVAAAQRYAKEKLADSHEAVRVILLDPDYSKLDEYEVYCSSLLKVFLFNVFDNSAYWMQSSDHDRASPGSVAVTAEQIVSLEQAPEFNNYIRLTMTDDGPGAPQDVVDELNSARLANVSRREGGEGYALRAFRDYLFGFGGNIHFSSELGVGFTATIDLPVTGGSSGFLTPMPANEIKE